MADDNRRATGGCLCGAVRYQVSGPLRPVINCHCGQCVKTHGHFAAYTMAAISDLTLIEAGGLKWYRSSARARRGFCGKCGASLFWRTEDGDAVSIAAGSLDQPSGLATAGNIFVADKPDYYEIADGLPRFPGPSAGRLDGDKSGS